MSVLQGPGIPGPKYPVPQGEIDRVIAEGCGKHAREWDQRKEPTMSRQGQDPFVHRFVARPQGEPEPSRGTALPGGARDVYKYLALFSANSSAGLIYASERNIGQHTAQKWRGGRPTAAPRHVRRIFAAFSCWAS